MVLKVRYLIMSCDQFDHAAVLLKCTATCLMDITNLVLNINVIVMINKITTESNKVDCHSASIQKQDEITQEVGIEEIDF